MAIRSSGKGSSKTPSKPTVQLKNKLRNCTECGRAFIAVSNEKLCRECQIKEEAKKTEVLAYVRENQGASIQEVIDNTGVSEKLVRQMIREGLFSNIDREDFYYPCNSCGRPIRSGTYCADCLSRLRKETKKMADQMAVKIDAKTGKSKPLSQMSTIERLNAMAEKEFEKENKRNYSKGMYADIVNRKENRIIGKK